MTEQPGNVHRFLGIATGSRRRRSTAHRPPVALLLEADRQHRRKVKGAARKKVTTKLVLRAPHGKWRFVARHDGQAGCVVVYYRASGEREFRGRRVMTADQGPLKGRRVVRGRIVECLKFYNIEPPSAVPTLIHTASYAAAAAAAAIAPMILPFVTAVDDEGNDEQEIVTAALENDFAAVDQPASAPAAPGVAPNVVSKRSGIIDGSPSGAGETRVALTHVASESGPNATSMQTPQQAAHTPGQARNRTVMPVPVKPVAPQIARTSPSVPVDQSAASVSAPAVASVAARRSKQAGKPVTPVVTRPAVPVPDDDTAPVSGPNRRGQKYTNVWVDTPSLPAADTPPVLALNATSDQAPGEREPSFSIETMFNEHRNANPGINFDPEQFDSYWQMNLQSLIAGSLKFSGQLAFSSFDPENEDGFGDDQYRAMRFAFQNSQGKFRYGARYRSAGKEFVKHKKDKSKFKEDREIWETWSSRRFGDVGIKTAYIQEQNNLQGDPEKPRLKDQEARVTFSHLLSDWPSYGYSLSYGTGTRESADEPAGYAAFRGPMKRLGASLYYASDRWNASLNAYQITAGDNQVGGRDSTTRGYGLSGSYYPSDKFSLSPWLGFTDEYYESDQSHTHREYLGLAVSRAFRQNNVRFNAYGSYYNERNPTWNLDTAGVYGQAGLVWSLNKRGRDSNSVGLYFTYNRYDDHVYLGSNTEEAAVWAVYKLNGGALPFYGPDDFPLFR